MIEHSDNTQIDKGKVKVNNKYIVAMFKKTRYRYKTNLSIEGV